MSGEYESIRTIIEDQPSKAEKDEAEKRGLGSFLGLLAVRAVARIIGNNQEQEHTEEKVTDEDRQKIA
jgi:hypothetical protein